VIGERRTDGRDDGESAMEPQSSRHTECACYSEAGGKRAPAEAG
jgi:hypothetical protein